MRALPTEQQNEVGRYLLALSEDAPLTPDEVAALDEAEAEIARGEGVSGGDLKAFWKSLGV